MDVLKLLRINESLDDLHEQANDWNGHEREKAVERLGEIGSVSSIPVLLKRANDWVPQVRESAKKALLTLCTSQNVDAFVLHLPRLFHLQTCSRADHRALTDQIIAYLIRAKNSKAIINNISNRDQTIARLCLMLSIKNKLANNETLIDLGFNHQDVIVRSMAFELFKPSLKSISKQLIEKAKEDTFMPIRREMLRMTWQASNEIDSTKVFLFDKHASVRALATRLLSDAGYLNEVQALYTEDLSSTAKSNNIKCSIWAIGHLTLTQFENHVRLHLNSTYSLIRNQALLTLVKLKVSDVDTIVKEGLYDQSPSVRKQSVRLHEILEMAYTADELLELQKNATHAGAKRSCFNVSRLSSRWERLIFFLSLLVSKRVYLVDSEVINDSISAWSVDSNRVAGSPSTRQILKLKGLIERKPSIINVNHSMPFLLKTFGVIDKA